MGAIFRGRKCYTGRVKFTDYQNIGKIDAFMRTTAPDGYLACDGSTYNIADYPLLCDVFASDFGSVNYFGGDGTTTFAVPDLRGEFLRGTGTNGHSGQGSGSNVGEHQDGTESPNGWSTNTYIQHGVSTTNSTNVIINPDHNRQTNLYRSMSSETVASATGSAYAYVTSRPTNTSVLYCIRAY